MCLKSDVTLVRSWDIIPFNVPMEKERGNIMHMQLIWKIPHLRRRKRNRRMKESKVYFILEFIVPYFIMEFVILMEDLINHIRLPHDNK
jgi:hypothetical protein